jgi:hypothetical protein
MDNEEVQRLLNRVLSLTPLEKNNFYHTLLTIIRRNSDPNKSAGDIIMEFDELLEQKRAKLDGILNGDPTGSSPSSGKPSPIFRRVQ